MYKKVNKFMKLIVVTVALSMTLLASGCQKHEHTYDTGVITEQPTCTKEGKLTLTCTGCKETVVSPIAKVPHEYDSGKVTKQPTYYEEGEMTYTCLHCDDSHKEVIPVIEEEVVLTVLSKKNKAKDAMAGRFMDRVEFEFQIDNMTDRDIRGVSTMLYISDLFGNQIMKSDCEFTGQTIPAHGSVIYTDKGIEVNPFFDHQVKLYNEEYDDLIFEYSVEGIVYADEVSEDNNQTVGAGNVENVSAPGGSSSDTSAQKVDIKVVNKTNQGKDIYKGRYSERVNFTFELTNNTDKEIKGIQGILTIYDLFGEEIMSITCDFTGIKIAAGETVTKDDLGIDVNQFMDHHVKLYNEEYEDLNFSYEVTAIVYADGTRD